MDLNIKFILNNSHCLVDGKLTNKWELKAYIHFPFGETEFHWYIMHKDWTGLNRNELFCCLNITDCETDVWIFIPLNNLFIINRHVQYFIDHCRGAKAARLFSAFKFWPQTSIKPLWQHSACPDVRLWIQAVASLLPLGRQRESGHVQIAVASTSSPRQLPVTPPLSQSLSCQHTSSERSSIVSLFCL